MSATRSPQRSRLQRLLSTIGWGIGAVVVAIVAAVVMGAAIDLAIRVF